MSFAPIKTGRPKDSFSDPVQRVRAWFWLEDVKAQSGFASGAALDASRLTKGLIKGQRFRSVEEDGTSPGQILANPTMALFEHVGKLPGYRFTKVNFLHTIWALLSDRESRHSSGAHWMEREWKKQGFCCLSSADIRRADMLGLQWPEIRGSWSGNENATIITHDQLDPERFESLDGLTLLLLTYRAAQNRSDFYLANHLGKTLQGAAIAIGKRFAPDSEARDTWDAMLQTRILSWNPLFEPSTSEIVVELRALEQEFRRREKTPKRGCAAVGPGQSKGGKVERRWRRRARMRAVNFSLSAERAPAGNLLLRQTNKYTSWLVNNAALIDKHEAQAMDEIMGSNIFDPNPKSADENIEMSPLCIPKDKKHQHKRPDVDPGWSEFIGEIPYDVIYRSKKRIRKPRTKS